MNARVNREDENYYYYYANRLRGGSPRPDSLLIMLLISRILTTRGFAKIVKCRLLSQHTSQVSLIVVGFSTQKKLFFKDLEKIKKRMCLQKNITSEKRSRKRFGDIFKTRFSTCAKLYINRFRWRRRHFFSILYIDEPAIGVVCFYFHL